MIPLDPLALSLSLNKFKSISGASFSAAFSSAAYLLFSAR
jgi:hypothetical protein